MIAHKLWISRRSKRKRLFQMRKRRSREALTCTSCRVQLSFKSKTYTLSAHDPYFIRKSTEVLVEVV